jgi:alpha-beta hydrolase superfamily lysophospholipase
MPINLVLTPAQMKVRGTIKKIGWILLFAFLCMNVVAFFHAWKFTHFSKGVQPKSSSRNLSFGNKAKTLFLGINNPRPVNKLRPSQPYETITIQSNKKIECWLIQAPTPKGTVILFHGYGGEKSAMLDKATVFQSLGFSTLLVDFMGAGNSEGNQTTIGYKEADEVKSCFEFLRARGEKRIILFGTSLGAAAILKSIDDFHLDPTAIILECPFSTLYETTASRFRSLKVPAFPMAGLLVFWGGIQNGFWGFSFEPVEYAKSVRCPTLLFFGEKDEKVSRAETDAIFQNLPASKRLVTFPEAGHENYLLKYRNTWSQEIAAFLAE